MSIVTSVVVYPVAAHGLQLGGTVRPVPALTTAAAPHPLQVRPETIIISLYKLAISCGDAVLEMHELWSLIGCVSGYKFESRIFNNEKS